MQFYSRNRIGVNMSRCVWISQIYKYRNIVPIWGKNHSLLWMWEQYSSGPQCWQRWWGAIAKRPPRSLQLPMADALTWENVCISGSNYIHWGAEIKWWTMYQTRGIFQIMHWFFSSRKRSKVMLTMLWVQNTSKFGAPCVLYLKDSFVHMTWLTQKYVLPFPPGTCLLIKELTAEAWVRSFCYSPTGFKEEGRQKRESQLPVSDVKTPEERHQEEAGSAQKGQRSSDQEHRLRMALGVSPNFFKPSFLISKVLFCVPGTQYAWRNMSHYYAGHLGQGSVRGGSLPHRTFLLQVFRPPGLEPPSTPSWTRLWQKTRSSWVIFQEEFLSPHPLSTSPVEKYPVLPSSSPERRGGRVGAWMTGATSFLCPSPKEASLFPSAMPEVKGNEIRGRLDTGRRKLTQAPASWPL